jgi:hypothetical protein
MTLAWPVALTRFKFTIAGQGLKFGRDVISFKPDSGDELERPRSTVINDRLSLACTLNTTEYLALEVFWKRTTAQGTKSFTMLDPDGSGIRKFKFQAEPVFGYPGNGLRSCSLELLRFDT